MTKSKENDEKIEIKKTQESLVKSKFGQHLLLLFIPFIYPKGSKTSGSPLERFIDALHLKILSPFIGSGFLILTITFTERLLKKKNIDLFKLINLDSVMTVYHSTIIVALMTYSMALSRYISQYLVKKLTTDPNFYTLPILYWCARYAGILIYVAFLIWIINFTLWLDLSLIGFLFFCVFFFVILYIGVIEIFKSFDSLRTHLSEYEQRILFIFDYVIFVLLFGILLYFYWHLFLRFNL